MSKFCSDCGKQLKNEKAIACVECGAAISQSVPGKKWSNNTKLGLYALSFLMPLFGGIAGIIGLFNENNRSTGAGLLIVSFFSWVFWTVIFMGLISI